MSEKKMVRRSVAIGLGIICIVLIAGLVGAMAYYMMTINNKDTTYNSYASSHTHTNSEYDSLASQYQNYMSNHSHTNSQYDAYVASHQHTDQEFDSVVTAPKLATLDVTTENDWSNQPYVPDTFYVHGYVVNAGSDTAYNPKIHVVAYGLSDAEAYVKAIDANVTLATMDGGSWTTFDSTFVYSGGPLADWTITPQWTTTP